MYAEYSLVFPMDPGKWPAALGAVNAVLCTCSSVHVALYMYGQYVTAVLMFHQP